MELVRLRTVAAEARKREERVARLVRRIDELTHESTTAAGGRLGVGGGVGVAGASDGERRQLEVTAASLPELAATSEERYVMTDGMGGTGEVLSAPPCDKPGNVHDKGGVTLGTKRLAAGAVGRATFRVEVPEFVPCGRHTSSLSTGTPPPAPGLSLSSLLATPTLVTRPPPPTAGATTMDASYGHGEAVVPVPTLAAAPLDALSRTLAQQLPPLPNFTGDHMDGDGESFQEWSERLEMVAATCHWDDQTKLENIATRLRGSASRFYRSCPPQQRSDYMALTTALKQRFTPVRIQAVQSSRFHERKQGRRQLCAGRPQALLSSLRIISNHRGCGSDGTVCADLPVCGWASW